ncbi:MAG TPA: hypothetical protein VHV78_01395, partial [Gemmatimonadaceae bacterium]|nr:hypothetical protein [Gemmatimonadaceae bacterium]
MLVSVALPLPLFRNFTYEVENADASRARVGMRAVVPFRNRREIGIIVDDAAEAPSVAMKRVLALPDESPVLSASLLALCRWISEYYVVPLGVAARSVLPAALWSHAAPRPAQRTRRVAAIVRELPSLIDRDREFTRAKRQRELFELLESIGGRAPVEHLIERLRFSPAVLRALVERGLVEVTSEVV